MPSRWDWDQLAQLPGLSPVIDYQPKESRWARYLDGLHKRALDRAVQARSTDRFIDYGCGVGRIAQWLAPRVAEVIGLDTSRAMIAAARRRNSSERVRFAVIEGDPRALPLRGYDGITAIWVLQHIVDEERFGAAIDFFAAALRAGGAVYTLDRLYRDRLDPGDSSYMRVRLRVAFEEAFRARGFETVTAHPILVAEEVLGRPSLSWLVKSLGLGGAFRGVDLAWARRRRDPEVADYLWHFRRSF